jgi:hypothetical protein
MDICFWCKRQKGLGEGDDTPQYYDYDFCEECEQKTNLGTTVIQVVEEPNGNKPIRENIYPTGKWVVLDKKTDDDVVFINEETWKASGLPEY